jgi:hypothetical protein
MKYEAFIRTKRFFILLFSLTGLILYLSFPTMGETAVEGIPCNPEPTDMFINYGNLVICSVDQSGDIDVYRFTATTGENVLIQGTWQSGSMRPCIELIAPDNSRLKACDNSFTNRIDTILNQTGTYTILFTDMFGTGTGEYSLALQCLSGACVIVPTIPIPSSQQYWTYPPIVSPVMDTDPSQAKPIGVGSIAEDGDKLSIRVGLGQFSGPVDVYFALFVPSIDPNNIYMLGSDYSLQPLLSMEIEPWKENTFGPIDEYLFGDIPTLLLPSGIYYLYLLVTPADSLDTYYLWSTYFVVPPLSSTEQYTLLVSTTGNGVVTSSDGKIQCGTDCSESYPDGTQVTLTATPDSGWEFSGWSGACSGTGTCDITLTSDTSVTATFTQQPSQQCANIAGDWNCSEDVTFKCTFDGITDTVSTSGTGTITIKQNGCNISYEVPYWDIERTGTIEGNNINVSGILVIPLIEDVYLSENIYTAKGTISGNQINMQGSGSAKGSFCYEGDCYNFSCNVVSNTVKCTRSSYMSMQRAIKKSSTLFINNYLKIFTVLSH